MSDIAVVVHTGMRQEPVTLDAPPDMVTQVFIDQLIAAVKMPRTKTDGSPEVYQLSNKSRGTELDPRRTLEQNGVCDQDQLVLLRKSIAGAMQFRGS